MFCHCKLITPGSSHTYPGRPPGSLGNDSVEMRMHIFTGGRDSYRYTRDSSIEFFKSNNVRIESDKMISRKLCNHTLDEFFQFHDICGKRTDPMGSFFSSHGILIESKAERTFVESDFFRTARYSLRYG